MNKDEELKLLRKLVTKLGDTITLVHDELENEDDRVYLGSTNHADDLREAHEAFSSYRFSLADKAKS